MKKILFTILFLLLYTTSCVHFADHDHRLRIRNNSSQTIMVYAAYILPDTSIVESKPELKEIQPGKFEDIYGNEVGDEDLGRLKTEKLSIFIFSKDTIAKFSWIDIALWYRVLIRMDVAENDLSNMGSISYP